jgi:hypothetical protein
MSEFLRKILGGSAEEMGGGMDSKEIANVFDAAVKAGHESMNNLLSQSRVYARKDAWFEATLFLFIAVWTMVRAVHAGVENSNKKGKRNPVNHLWSAVRTAFSSIDDAVAAPRMLQFEKRWEEGFYDEWH